MTALHGMGRWKVLWEPMGRVLGSRQRCSENFKTNIRHLSKLIKDHFTSRATGKRIDRQSEPAGPIFWDMHTAEIIQERRPEDSAYIGSTSPLTISTISGSEVSQVHYFPGYADHEFVSLLEYFTHQYVSFQGFIFRMHRRIQHQELCFHKVSW